MGKKMIIEFEDKKASPVGVNLTAEEQEYAVQVARELGMTRHALLLHVCRKFLNDYRNGKRPKTKTIVVIDDDE